MSSISMISTSDATQVQNGTPVAWHCKRVAQAPTRSSAHHSKMARWIQESTPAAHQSPIREPANGWFITFGLRLYAMLEEAASTSSDVVTDKAHDGTTRTNAEPDEADRSGKERTSGRLTPCNDSSDDPQAPAASDDRRSRRVYNIADIW